MENLSVAQRPAAPAASGPGPEGGDALLQLLDLDQLDQNFYASSFLFADRHALYGGQVAAQALRAAGLMVAADRPPHSLHGYFLRAGDATRPTTFEVHCDRDGRSFSARRVVARQGDAVIFTMSASFQVAESGPGAQVPLAPVTDRPEEAESYRIPRLFGMEGRHSQPVVDRRAWPTRFWARSTSELGEDPLLHSCVLTYLSDLSTGLFSLNGPGGHASSSLDHVLWFHRPVRLDGWVLLDLLPQTTAHGRGFYTGSVWTPDGGLAASIAQETLFRAPA